MFFAALFLVILVLGEGTPISTVSPEVLTNLKLFAEYSAAAYCPENYLSTANGSSICPSNVCPDLHKSANELDLLHQILPTSKSPAAGIIVIDHSNKTIVTSFRGTQTNRDWETNINFVLLSADDVCDGCWVHAGFLESWRGLMGTGRTGTDIFKVWNTAAQHNSGYKTVVTGHSLGGAIATLTALHMKKLKPGGDISLYTYGVPRVGNPAFATFLETTLETNIYRTSHLNDPVPRLPGRIFGFRHPYPEFHITSPHIPNVLDANESMLTAPSNLIVTPEDVLVLDQEESDEGNLGYTCTNIAMHDAYSVDISKCATGDDTPILGVDICDWLDICCSGTKCKA